MFMRSEQLSKQENLKDTRITLDVGPAIKAYHMQWKQPERQSKIFVH